MALLGLDKIPGIGGIFEQADTSWKSYTGETSADIAKDNLKFQKKKWSYDKALQQQMFGREDSAIQRRVKDLEAAGMSKVLAAGQGASAGPVVSTEAPQRDPSKVKNPLGAGINLANLVMSMIGQKADVSRTYADTELARKKIDETSQRVHNLQQDYAINKYNWQKYKELGVPTDTSSDMKSATGIFSILEKVFKLKQEAPDNSLNRDRSIKERIKYDESGKKRFNRKSPGASGGW